MPSTDETALVAAALANTALAPVIMAAWDAGEAVLPLNPGLPAAELDRLLDIARPTHIIDADGTRTVRANGVPAPADTAAVVCTSGTTGQPKAVELTRSGLQAMGAGVSKAIGATDGDRWLACHPLFFVAGLAILGRSWVTGVPVTVHDGFEPERVSAAPADDGVTIVSLVPTTLRRLLRAGSLGRFRAVVVGGAPLPQPLRDEAASTGVEVFDAYGLTETWGGCVTNGMPNDTVEARLLDTSEVALRGVPLMRRYRNDDALTNEALGADGWFRTGDVGAWSHDGRLAIVDRLKDLVITGGVNVSPTEVEGVLAQHHAVADACVIGVPDDEWGERVVACIVPRDPADPPGFDDVRAFVRERLGATKAPKELRIVDVIPRSPSGKALRRLL
ncbi:MAG TPA: AMP-binding protein [Acidimicrobiia bacterium]